MNEPRTCVGILTPGAMGSALGRAWRDGGARVVTTVTRRSPRTARLVADAGLEVLPDLDAVLAVSDILVSVGPPDRAMQIATDVATTAASSGRRPLVADLNAVSPQTVERVAAALTAQRLDLVDGSISGGPPRPGGTTRLYLSGTRAGELAALPGDGVDARVVGARTGTASAVKMCTASVFKGFGALLAQAMLTARAHGVESIVLDDLARDYPDLPESLPRDLSLAASKAWRYVGEMREIALTQGAAGARPELFAAMADVWTAVSGTALASATPEQATAASDLASVLDDLARPAG